MATDATEREGAPEQVPGSAQESTQELGQESAPESPQETAPDVAAGDVAAPDESTPDESTPDEPEADEADPDEPEADEPEADEPEADWFAAAQPVQPDPDPEPEPEPEREPEPDPEPAFLAEPDPEPPPLPIPPVASPFEAPGPTHTASSPVAATVAVATPDPAAEAAPSTGELPRYAPAPPPAIRGPAPPARPARPALSPEQRLAIAHRRRQRRQTLTFLTFFLFVLAMGAAAYTFYQGKWSLPSSNAGTTTTVCPSSTPSLQPIKGIQLRVYNGTNRHGLALTISHALAGRGFQITEIPRNDPLEAKIPTAAALRFGVDGALAAHTVAAQINGSVTMVQDGRAGATVDVVLGNAFSKLRTPAEAKKALKPMLVPYNCSPTPS